MLGIYAEKFKYANTTLNSSQELMFPLKIGYTGEGRCRPTHMIGK